MASLSNCWLLVEYFIIPYGYVKWFYLSFYMHPFFLFFCQIFLWFRWLPYILVVLPFKITCYLCSCVLVFLRRFIKIIHSFAGFRDSEAVNDVPEHENMIPELISRNQHHIVDSCSTTQSVGRLRLLHYEVGVSEILKIGFSEVDDEAPEELENANISEVDDEAPEGLENADISEVSSFDIEEVDFSSSDQFSFSESPVSSARDVGMNLPFPVAPDSSSNDLAVVEQEFFNQRDDREEVIDSFYKSYEERMRWFDLLNHDRAFALSIVQSNQSASNIIAIQGAEAGHRTYVPDQTSISWGKMVKSRMLKSLENDFEMVYVAQSCLTWEALCHQHQKVMTLTAACSSTSTSPLLGSAFYYNSNDAGNFQKFKIMLERFMEDERLTADKRYWNYVQKRSSLKSILQVPDISGSYTEEEKEGRIGAREMLKAIEKCIKAFWLFLESEKKKPWWKASRSVLWTPPCPLEDPRDLKLFHDLTNTFQQKERRLKDLNIGKKRYWLKKEASPLDEKKEMLFTMIEMKLVWRVL